MTTAARDYPRLEEQIDWLDAKSQHHQRRYRWLKIVAICAAALVPLVSSLSDYSLLAGALGVVVVIVEGLQHTAQHHENWLRYRSTCEHLRREKFLYLGGAGHYDGLDPDAAFRQLVVVVESVLAREGEQWLSLRSDVEREVSTTANNEIH